MRQERCSVGVDAGGEYGSTLPLELLNVDELATVLSQALCDEPQFGYMIPDPQTRLRFLHSFFGNAIRASELNGEIHPTQGVDGAALWIGPGRGFTLRRVLRASPTQPLPWDWATLRRHMNVVMHLDQVHQQLVRGPHWYLLAFGLAPSKQNQNAGSTLIEPLLARADSEGLPCYLETFNARHLPLYESHGFRIAGSGKIPRGGPDFWAMLRSGRSGSGYSNPEF